ncbi:hypothetical protein [Phytomonospora endophytica]|uniref:Uncharacterized protein n=1 Tax=Phytomonospora endophytica TaxID=714109 RepID=A0A841FXQ3_9ACTN|nr:hypothetical protein [Phytomonospora endophytica]MBB6038137.1 hypothetical protein [Phytomonospora endophytica]
MESLDWPADGGELFRAGGRAGRFYWARGRPSLVFADDWTPSFAELLDAIPMGYTSLSLLERVALYNTGREVRVWRPDATQAPDRPPQPFQLLLPPFGEHGHQLLTATSVVGPALREGRELSARTRGKVLVCQAISQQGWH